MTKQPFATTVFAFIALGMFALSSLAEPAAKPARIGVLWHAGSAAEEGPLYKELEQGFRDRGYIIGKTVVFEHRFPNEIPERFETMAAELVGLQPDLIVASTTRSALAVQRRTSTIPLVFVVVGDPVATKLVSSLSRPGGNVTGFSVGGTQDLSAKRVQLLKEAFPPLRKVAVVFDPQTFGNVAALEATTDAARAYKLNIRRYDVQRNDEFEAAFAAMVKDGTDAVLFLPSAIAWAERSRIANLAMKHKLPAMFPYSEFAQAGGLMSYAPSLTAQLRRVGIYAERILKGARAGDLPVELPTQYDFVINQRTAKALNAKIAPSVVVRASEVIH
jgi:putative ABC transport system substrate-binding protein